MAVIPHTENTITTPLTFAETLQQAKQGNPDKEVDGEAANNNIEEYGTRQSRIAIKFD